MRLKVIGIPLNQIFNGSDFMIDWLYTLPNFGITLLFGLVGAVSFAVAPFLREKLWPNRMRSEHSDAASSAFSVVTGFTGLVLAFSLVQAQGNLRNLETQVSAEAHDLAQLDRLLVRYGDQSVAAIRAPLHEYANSILTDEWPQLHKGRSSERTAALFRPISRAILAIEPPAGRQTLIYAEILKKVDELAAEREDRTGTATNLRLPRIFWETMICLVAILLLLATFSEATFGRAVALLGEGFGLALLVALVFIFDQPFKGQTSVSPAPIAKVVAEMQIRTF